MESNKFMRYNNNNVVKLDEDELECLRKLGDNHRQQTNKKVEKSRNFGNGYNMVRLDEDELECLRKLGDHHQQKTNKKVESGNFGNGYDMVRLDEDELECLRKLGDNNNHRQHKNVDNIDHYNVVRLDEDELECLRKLGDQHNQHTVGSNKYKMVSIDEDEGINDASVVRPFSSKGSIMMKNEKKKKLESKKSEDINESAEKFIQKFKQQLILQRLESIENVDKMLARGL